MTTIKQLKECLTPNVEVMKQIIQAIGPEAEEVIHAEGMNQIEAGRQLAILIHTVTGTPKADAWDLIFGKGSYHKFMTVLTTEAA